MSIYSVVTERNPLSTNDDINGIYKKISETTWRQATSYQDLIEAYRTVGQMIPDDGVLTAEELIKENIQIARSFVMRVVKFCLSCKFKYNNNPTPCKFQSSHGNITCYSPFYNDETRSENCLFYKSIRN
jgi:hypothetical protein